MLRSVFIDILLRCNSENGELEFSQSDYAKKTKLNRTSINRYLQRLEQNNIITILSSTKGTVLIISNWRKYQQVDENANCEQVSEQVKNTKKQIRNEENTKNLNKQMNKQNDVKNSKKITKRNNKTKYLDEDVQLTELLFLLMNNNTSNLKPRQPSENDFDLMRKIREIDERDTKMIKGVIVWCQQDSFWRKNVRSVGSLRKNFEKLYLQAESDYNQRYKGKIISI